MKNKKKKKPNNNNSNNPGPTNNNQMNLNYFLIPKDTKNALGANPHQIVNNLYLLYHKLIQAKINNNKGEILKYYNNLCNVSDKIYQVSFFNKINNQNIESAKSLFGENYKAFEMTNQWRLAIGLGNESVYETSLSLHYIYGIPYIPGQSLKGAVRSYIIQTYFNGNESLAISTSEAFCKIFGTPEFIEVKGKRVFSILKKDFQGDVVFYDAFPKDSFQLKEDIMNPHYSEYYSSKKPPADIYAPIPIKFLVLEETRFQFIIGLLSRENYEVEWQGKEIKILDLIEQLTKEALEKGGLGGKTSVGYGYFQ